MRYSFYTLFLLLGIICCGTINQAQACDCPTKGAINSTLAAQYDLIGRMVVESSEKGKDFYKASVKWIEVYKGNASEHMPLFFDGEGECAVSLEKGSEWLVYANYAQLGKPYLKFCSHSRKKIENEDKIRTDYVPLEMSFSSERDWLVDQFGIQTLVKESSDTSMGHHNIIPERKQALWLILCSLGGFIVLWFGFKKWIK